MGALATLRRWTGCQRGSATVELALALPVLTALLLSGLEAARLVLINQKLECTAATMADLVTRAEAVAEADLADMFAAAGYAMTPFDLAAGGRVIVSSISATGGAAPAISWQRAFGAGGGASAFGIQGAGALLPAGFAVRDGENVIVAEAFFDFSALFTAGLINDVTLQSQVLMRPRFGALSVLN